MAENDHEIGSISWTNLTIEDAEPIRNFYSQVVGWKFEFVSMGEYSDYGMLTPDTKRTVAGICHTNGSNDNIPPQWMIYITVESIEKSIEDCRRLGGKIISRPKTYAGVGKYCVIQDPAGAVCALFEYNK
jgi:uncharacterized protein